MFGRHRDNQHKPQRSWVVRISICVLLALISIVVFRAWTAPTRRQRTPGDRFEQLLNTAYSFDPRLIQALSAGYSLIDKNNQRSGETLIDTILAPFQSTEGPLLTLFSRYFPQQYLLVREFSQFRNDIVSLLGFERPQTYLIVLQNTSEKRPNGGFFGSFGLVTFVEGHITDLQIIDSYHPGHNRPQTKILGPEWLNYFLPDRDIYFIGANKIGFTYHDGPHIKTLYERSYPGRTIRGVIFVRTDMVERLLPGFTEQIRHRQYVNATIDLLRGESQRGKKDAYRSSLEEFVHEHRFDLIQEIRTQLPELINDRLINVYLENISGSLHTRLRERHLTTRFEDDHAYFRDSNIIFNKIDRFVEKTIDLRNQEDVLIAKRTNDIIDLPDMVSGDVYTFTVTYTLAVPESYEQFIAMLNNAYDIELFPREEHILGLTHQRASRGVVYLPEWMSVIDTSGDYTTAWQFSTPFSHNIAYEISLLENNSSGSVSFNVAVK